MVKDIVSIEKVLNSRCSSDFAGASRKRHWGTYKDTRPDDETIRHIIKCCAVPRFSDGKLELWHEDQHLFLGFRKPEDQFKEHLLNIESGMQQEAVYLACAALGVGTCIHNQGINGTEYGNRIATASHLIMDMLDPYETGKLTTKVPGPKKPFITGKNLSEPMRTGELECLPELERLVSFNKSGTLATEKDISQLLWAAKGITPHHVGSHPWGLTIPTWGHGQEYTDVYLVKNGALFRYKNWTKHIRLNSLLRKSLAYIKWGFYRDSRVNVIGNPTHDITFLRKVNVSTQLDGADVAIILCRNEKTCRALWEIGYMLENMFLQAQGLGISFKSKIFEIDETVEIAKEAGVTEAVAVLLL